MLEDNLVNLQVMSSITVRRLCRRLDSAGILICVNLVLANVYLPRIRNVEDDGLAILLIDMDAFGLGYIPHNIAAVNVYGRVIWEVPCIY